MRKIIALGCTPVLLALGCAQPEPEPVDGRVEVPEPPADGFQLVSPDIVIPPGEDKMMCWVPDIEITEPMRVKQMIGLQNGMGHHLAGFLSSVPRQAGEVFDCTQLESMTTIEPFLVPANEPGTTEAVEGLQLFPEGFAVNVPAGARMVFQSHYINIGDEPMVVADVAQLHLVQAEEDEDFVDVGYWTLNHGLIDIPAGEEGTVTRSCEIQREFQMLSMLGHMHDWGTGITVEIEREGAFTTIYEELEWTAEFRDLPPILHYTAEEPLRFQAGDKVHVTCSFNNDTDRPLRFPEEMCVAFGAYQGNVEDGFFICD
jgi:hypothetical protein